MTDVILQGPATGTSFGGLLSMGRKDLMDVLCSGYPIDRVALNDREYRGVSLGLPHWVERLTWKKFKKVFHYDPELAILRGWNVRIADNGLDEPWEPLMDRVMDRHGGAAPRPRTFGHFGVAAAAAYRLPRPCGAGLMLDYGRGGNRPFDPLRWLRDPLVAVNPGSVELLLGWSYLDFGWLRIPTPSFFALVRDIPLSHRVLPPRPDAGLRALSAAPGSDPEGDRGAAACDSTRE